MKRSARDHIFLLFNMLSRIINFAVVIVLLLWGYELFSKEMPINVLFYNILYVYDPLKLSLVLGGIGLVLFAIITFIVSTIKQNINPKTRNLLKGQLYSIILIVLVVVAINFDTLYAGIKNKDFESLKALLIILAIIAGPVLIGVIYNLCIIKPFNSGSDAKCRGLSILPILIGILVTAFAGFVDYKAYFNETQFGEIIKLVNNFYVYVALLVSYLFTFISIFIYQNNDVDYNYYLDMKAKKKGNKHPKKHKKGQPEEVLNNAVPVQTFKGEPLNKDMLPNLNLIEEPVKKIVTPSISIMPHQFEGNPKIKTAEIPATYDCIGEYAFANCINLEKIILYKNITMINDYAFYECPKLKLIEFKGTKEQFKAIRRGYGWVNNTLTINCIDGPMNLKFSNMPEGGK